MRKTIGPQANNNLASILPSMKSVEYRRRADVRLYQEVRLVPPRIQFHFGASVLAAHAMLLAGPHFPRAGFVYLTIAAAPLSVFPGEFGGTMISTRLHFRGRGRGGASARRRALFRSSTHLRVRACPRVRSGRYPGP